MKRSTANAPSDPRLTALLHLQGDAFLEAAFRAVLGRGIDPQGRANYLARLAAGARKRTIVAELVFSSEGRSRGAHVGALGIALRSEFRWRKFPRVLRLLDWGAKRATAAPPVAALAPYTEAPAAPFTLGLELAGVLSVRRRESSESLRLRAFVDGEACGELAFAAGESFARLGLPGAVCGARPHAFWVASIEGEGPVDVIHGAVRPAVLFCDLFDGRSIEGWCHAPHGSGAATIVVEVDGVRVARVETDVPRRDVAAHLGLADPHVGFRVTLPATAKGTRAHVVARIEGIDDCAWVLEPLPAFERMVALAAAARREDAPPSLAESRLLFERAALGMADAVTGAAHLVLNPLPRSGPSAVTVVIPVYGGALETRECLASALASQNACSVSFVVIDDASPDAAVGEVLAELAARHDPRVRLVRRRSNEGFAAAVNLGMAIAKGDDVILLNADAVVGDGWVDRMVAAAARDARIGTLTPFSNNAELCTVPAPCVSAPVVSEEVRRRLDDAARTANRGCIVDLPVAHGFCMFIRRACLDEIGAFDAATWGRGYGEEVDFCLKAASRGWRHGLCADVFVVHRGGVSFGEEKLARVLENNRKISARYPFYDAMIQRVLAADPMGPARRAVSLSVLRDVLPSHRRLHLTHALGGGTDRYVRDLATLQEAEGACVAVLRADRDGDVSLEVRVPAGTLGGFFPERVVERFRSDEVSALLETLAAFGFGSVHVHTALFVPEALLAWASAFAGERLVTVHDYVWACPRVTMTDDAGESCGEPDAAGCNACLTRRAVHPGVDALVAERPADIVAYRKRFLPLFSGASRVFAGGADVAERMRRSGFAGAFRVVPHPAVPRAGAEGERPLGAGRATNDVVLLGALSAIKGSERLERLARRALERRLPLRFVVFGYTNRDSSFRDVSNVAIRGAYAEEELPAMLREHRGGIALFLNRWPETYSYTLDQALTAGLWPVVTDIGVPAERVRSLGAGHVVPYAVDDDSLLDLLLTECARARASVTVHPSPCATWSAYAETTMPGGPSSNPRATS